MPQKLKSSNAKKKQVFKHFKSFNVFITSQLNIVVEMERKQSVKSAKERGEPKTE